MASEINENQSVPLKEALQRFVDVYLKGQRPDIDEFVKQYPQHQVQLKRRIQDLQEIDTLFDSIFQAEGREFDDEAAGSNLVGRKIGSFEITEMVGRGGMGVVYLAHDTKLKRSVAVKSMPAALAGDSTARMRFRREAELLASLNHPNIAVIHEIIEEEESGYLILEYVPGQTLSECIAGKPLKLEQALSIGRQIAGAISAAHKKGIVHRDLKPGNIKITPDGQVKVLDFGLAKPSITGSDNAQTTATQHHHIMGTPAYMSPEQARGRSADHRTDIWSFGCIMYQMLTGRLPFEAETATDTLARIIEREPDWAALPQDTPTSIRTLVQRCLQKDPDQRPGDIEEAITQITETLSTPPATLPRSLTRTATIVGAAVIVVLCAVGLWFALQEKPEFSLEERRLVVLPFENLTSAENEYFADGMTDEITTRLAGIRGLGVVSHQSAIQYKNKQIGAQQIASELNVDYILEGTVQCERPSDPNSQVRIRVQLIRAADDAHVWAQSFDKDMRNVFRLQFDVAELVAHALGITLLESEWRALASEATDSIEAYDYYLRGRFNPFSSEDNLKIGIRMFDQAIVLDPKSARFHATLANVLIESYFRYGRNPEYSTRAREEAEMALKLDPDLFVAHVVLGRYYYQCLFDYDRAYEQFDWACREQPNYPAGWRWMGLAQRRQGRFKESLANLKRASELNPLDLRSLRGIPTALKFLREYAEAETYLDRIIRLEPDKPGAYGEKTWMCILQGNTKKAREVMEEALVNVSKDKESQIYDWLVKFDIYDGDYAAAIEKLSSKTQDVDMLVMFIPNDLRKAEIYGYMGKKELEKQCYESAVDVLEEKVAENPNVSRYRSALGIAYAGLGLEQQAIEQGLLGVEYEAKDAVDKPQRIEDLARIYAMVGKHDEAIEKLEYLLSTPSETSGHLLGLDPVWTPLRKYPRFQELVNSNK